VVKYGSEQGIHSGGNKVLEKFVGDHLPAETAAAYEDALKKENVPTAKSQPLEGQQMVKVEEHTAETELKSSHEQLILLAGLMLLVTMGFFFKRSSFAKDND